MYIHNTHNRVFIQFYSIHFQGDGGGGQVTALSRSNSIVIKQVSSRETQKAIFKNKKCVTIGKKYTIFYGFCKLTKPELYFDVILQFWRKMRT